jgi:hypothetical protein
MLPEKCSIKHKGRWCVNPPEFTISIISQNNDEYMVGVTCQKHKDVVHEKILSLQKEGKIPSGKINFTILKAVGTDCINAKPDDADLIHL